MTEPKKKYEKSALPEEVEDAMMTKLNQLLETEKPYLQSDLSLPRLAELLNTTPHHLSQLLNDRLGQNFFDWLATYRIMEAQILLNNPAIIHLKIDEIAERVGYNSPSAFHTAFKRITNQTPRSFGRSSWQKRPIKHRVLELRPGRREVRTGRQIGHFDPQTANFGSSKPTKNYAVQRTTNPFQSCSRPLSSAQTARRHDLDWLRVIAILTLLFYHTGMIYVSWGWHIKSAEHSQPMEEVMRWLHRWRMPLLFFISGAGTFFALRKRSFGSYAGERVRRLFVPLVFGMFVIVPPQIYIEWLFRERFSGSYADFYPEVFNFQPYKDGGTGGAFSWHHLWFICYLFFYSLISIPVFRWLQRESGQRFIDWVSRLIARPGGAMWLGSSVIFISQIVLKPFFPEETHALLKYYGLKVHRLKGE